jgi:hypothetical protein
MFRDHRTAGAWLPKTMYTTSFQESGYRALAEFDGDVDLTTGSARGVVLQGEHLSTWNENAVPFRGRGGDTQNRGGVWIGWNNRLAANPDAAAKEGEAQAAARKAAAEKPAKNAPKTPPSEQETLKLGPPATFSISVPDPIRSEWGIGEASVLYLSLAVTNTKPGPRTPRRDPAKEEEAEQAKEKAAKAKPPPKPPARPKPPPKKKEEPDLTPVDFTVELVDAAGRIARLPLSRFGIARHPLDARIYRREGRDAQRFTNIYELVSQTFVMPLADFTRETPAFDPRQIATIRLVLDKTEAGTIILDRVGVSTPRDSAFLAAPIGG